MRSPTAEVERMPLNLLLDRICNDLYLMFRANNYKDIGFTLIAHATDTGEGAASGNLKPDGVKALLEDCLERINEAEKPPENKVQ
jgi:hypothetical protein